MKQLLGALVSVGLLLSVNSHAQQVSANDKKPRFYAYKCHLTLADKRQVIRDYRRQPQNQNGNLQRMLMAEQVVVEKSKRLAVIEVHECVERDSEFSKAVARELDRNTLR
ncbi:TapY2 family type IVa secretion system protein [Rheinheimera fenheensis]|uniref:TapY2 family type IVa secretion system protein n=1 Tax=Rheinheimera fenheensis TaxID=3152295 RepID=UPI00325DFF24